MRADITVLPGDGIGPEVTSAAVAVLEHIAICFGHDFHFQRQRIGGDAIDASGTPLPVDTLEACRQADAILLGAVGGPKWSSGEPRPEQGLLALRKQLDLYANLRPVRPEPIALEAAPVKSHLLAGVDLLVVRELTGGIYFGDRHRDADSATDTCRYSVAEIERVVRRAAQLARRRSRRLTSVDKANVLETSRLWREVTTRVVAQEFPEVQLEHQLVDSMAMHLLARPRDYDVVVTENLFGDILTDEASMLAGSMGLLPSASLGEGGRGLYEPIHGSAPDIAGRDIANPCGAILSAAMLLRHSLGLPEEAELIEAAVSDAIAGGALTADLTSPERAIGCRAMTEAVKTSLKQRLSDCRVVADLRD